MLRSAIPPTVLVVSLLATVWAWRIANDNVQQTAAVRFERQVGAVDNVVDEAINSHLSSLKGLQALYASSETVERKEFHAFVESLNLAHDYPSIRALEYVAYVPPELKDSVEQRWAEDGTAGYKVITSLQDSASFTVEFIEPLAGNEARLGLDLSESGPHRAAATRARDTGEPSATAMLDLSRAPGDKNAFVIFLPIFRHGSPVSTVGERRQALQGWVAGVFQLRNLSLSGSNLPLVEIDCEIYDGNAPSVGGLLYDSNEIAYDSLTDVDLHSAFTRSETIGICGRPWTIVFNALPAFEANIDATVPRLVASLGLIIACLLFGVTWSLNRTRSRALILAEQMTQSLRESEERFRSAFQDAIIGMAVNAPNGRWLRVNSALCNIVGYSETELLAMDFQSITHPDDVAADVENAGKLLCGEIHQYVAEKRYIHKSGSTVWIQLTVAMVRDPEGRPLHFVSQIRDISARKIAERELADVSSAMSNAVEGIVRVESDGRITSVNEAFAASLGYMREELIGFHALDLFHAADRDWMLTHFGEMRIHGKAQAELRAKTRDGAPCHLEIVLVRIVSQDGAFAGHFMLSRDITSRKNSEARLTVQYAAARALAESVTLGEAAKRIIEAVCSHLDWLQGALWTLDRDANVLRYVDAWQAPGVAQSEFISANINETFGPGEGLPGRTWVEEHVVWIDDFPSEPGFKRAPIARINGLVTAFAFPIRLHGQTLGVIEFFSREKRKRDEDLAHIISSIASQCGQFMERKIAEEQVASARKIAEAASKAKSEFLAQMSHELRTPLNAVFGFSGILKKNKSGHLVEDELLCVERIQKNGKQLLGMINNILDLSTLESGGMALQLDDVNLASLIDELLAQTSHADGEVRLIREIPDGVKTLRTDPEKLKQVLSHLVDNALRFTHRGGVTVRLRCDSALRPAVLEVLDTGLGIPGDKRGRIFEAFQQVDNSIARKFGGAGLGLALSRGLCKLMGFSIECRSELGKGSIFSIVFQPAFDPGATAVQPSAVRNAAPAHVG